MNDDTQRLFTELDALAAHVRRRRLGAAETPVLFAHAAGMTIGGNVAIGAITREDALRSIEQLAHHMKAAAGLAEESSNEQR